MLLAVLAIKIVIRAIDRSEREVVETGGHARCVGRQCGTGAVGASLGSQARRTDPGRGRTTYLCRRADDHRRHPGLAIGRARGHPWLDTVFALLVASLVTYLAYGLFRRAIPVLVDGISHESEAIVDLVRDVDGVTEQVLLEKFSMDDVTVHIEPNL